jgi:hypothetical protein
MTKREILSYYSESCRKTLEHDPRPQRFLEKHGINHAAFGESINLGFSDGKTAERIEGNEQLQEEVEKSGIVRNGIDVFAGSLIVPILDENKEPVNIVGFSINPRKKDPLTWLDSGSIFNEAYLSHCKQMILTEDPIHALFLMQADVNHVTFVFGDERKYLHLCQEHRIREVLFTYEGNARLLYEMTKSGISTSRIVLDFDRFLAEKPAKDEIEALLAQKSGKAEGIPPDDTIQEIEGGFLFRFPLLTYRVLGSFSDSQTTLRVNIRALRDETIFLDSIDLYKNRDRQNFIYNILERFDIRDQMQVEQDLNTIISVIEKHKENRRGAEQSGSIMLTEHQQAVGLDFLKSRALCSLIVADYDELGYVGEEKNKLLLYLIMTSRLMDSPLHALILARSGAGKSRLAEITAELCPPEEVQNISDLSEQSLYYFGEDDLKHHFILIGERQGSQAAEYPLRELISRKSIAKAIPMKDSATNQIKTVVIKVNGPVSLVETATDNSVIHPENLNRCFVIGIDESEEQTFNIHELQRESHTVDGYLKERKQREILNRHIYAQRMLRSVQVFNPFAKLLSFPTAKLRSRRDNEKFLRLISAICFLHQYQRPLKTLDVDSGEQIEYIECSIDDYRIAYELLSDGVLENTLDDLPAPARKLLDLIKTYLEKRSKSEGIAADRIVFERKDIREFTSWSFAQVRNNIRILKDYEYIRLTKAQNGLANQYRLTPGYTGLDFLHTILSPEELKNRIGYQKNQEHGREAREALPIYGAVS